MAEDLFELASDLKLGRFTLGGHSMGGKAAIDFALRWPEKLNGLVIIDISPFGSTDPANPFYIEHQKILESIISAHPETSSGREEVERMLTRNITSERTRSFIMKNLKRDNGGRFIWKLDAEVLYRNLASITDGVADRGELPAPVTGFPVIFVRGGESEYITGDLYGDINKVFPVAEIITIPGAGHWVHAEKPDEIAEVFLRILRGN
jgi:pimeloyl-ACP methyl ester carboxylesterase